MVKTIDNLTNEQVIGIVEDLIARRRMAMANQMLDMLHTRRLLEALPPKIKPRVQKRVAGTGELA